MIAARTLKTLFVVLIGVSPALLGGCASARASADPQDRTSDAAPGDIRTSHERATERE
jgi:hypothetical protein